MKVTYDGQPCPHCGAPVVKVVNTRQHFHHKQKYYFEWHFRCPNCRAIYMVEAAKRAIPEREKLL